MTDNEIIKAFNDALIIDSMNIDLWHDKEDKPIIIPLKRICDLINRQQSENERLQNTLDDVLDRQPKLVANAEKYIVEELVDKITDRASAIQVGNLSWVWQISQDDIDDVKKEMVGESYV